jgi:hypothetical protein
MSLRVSSRSSAPFATRSFSAVSICTFVPVISICTFVPATRSFSGVSICTRAPTHAGSSTGRCTHAQRARTRGANTRKKRAQVSLFVLLYLYLYFCTSKASKRRTFFLLDDIRLDSAAIAHLYKVSSKLGNMSSKVGTSRAIPPPSRTLRLCVCACVCVCVCVLLAIY